MGKSSKAQDAAMRREYQEKRRREEEEKRRRENKLMWQIVIGLLAIIVLISAVAIGISLMKDEPNEDTEDRIAPTMEDIDFSAVDIENTSVTEDVTDYVRLNISYTDLDGFERTGDVIVRLFPEVAPKTVENFKELVADDFYDGLTFHRISSGFMIQGGDPEGDGSGDSGRTIEGEFTSNGFTNNLKHVRGVLSMARGDSNNSASCQFFIVHDDSSWLNGKYASFGYVVYGMDTVDGIAMTDVKQQPNSDEISSPINPVTINYATFVEVSE